MVGQVGCRKHFVGFVVTAIIFFMIVGQVITLISNPVPILPLPLTLPLTLAHDPGNLCRKSMLTKFAPFEFAVICIQLCLIDLCAIVSLMLMNISFM